MDISENGELIPQEKIQMLETKPEKSEVLNSNAEKISPSLVKKDLD